MSTILTRPKVIPKLTLIGAGPGDPELLTLKAIRALKNAKVILYDALVHPETLSFASSKAIKRFVGKRAGRHTYSQKEINDMIVQYALTHGEVVRLKGGDPFVFGRGYEELVHAESYQIETSVIPGITSATSLPALQKIPLTSRGTNESFWVLTGATSERQVSNDIFLAAQTKATAIILMGIKRIGEIADIYREAGKGHLPTAVIINGSMPDEQLFIGKINNMEERLEKECITGPGLIVIGEAVKFYIDKQEKERTTQKKNFSFSI